MVLSHVLCSCSSIGGAAGIIGLNARGRFHSGESEKGVILSPSEVVKTDVEIGTGGGIPRRKVLPNVVGVSLCGLRFPIKSARCSYR